MALARPIAARVPRTTAISVATGAMTSAVARARPASRGLVEEVVVWRSEKPSGSSDSISAVKVKKCSALKQSGMMTRIGTIRKTGSARRSPGSPVASRWPVEA